MNLEGSPSNAMNIHVNWLLCICRWQSEKVIIEAIIVHRH